VTSIDDVSLNVALYFQSAGTVASEVCDGVVVPDCTANVNDAEDEQEKRYCDEGEFDQRLGPLTMHHEFGSGSVASVESSTGPRKLRVP
jgi:hypothetical protein